jgi:hypothetical protein
LLLNYDYGDSSFATGYYRQDTYSITEMNSLFTLTYDWKITSDLDMNLLYGNEWIDKTVTKLANRKKFADKE